MASPSRLTAPQLNPPGEKKWMLYGTVLVLLAGFIIIVGLVLLLSNSGSFEKCIAVLNINNPLRVDSVSQSLFMNGLPGSEEIAEEIEKINKRSDIGALLIVIDSPGGSPVASREVYNSLKSLNKTKVAYFRETAASGAYYVAMGADYIISEPDAITGSIGVIATFGEMSGLLDKIGANVSTIKSGQYKDIGSPTRPITKEEKEILQNLINEVFEDFKSVILENRREKLNIAKFNEILDGRVISGRQAKEIGMVDALGDKKNAIVKTAELANLKQKPRICEIKIKEGRTGLFNIQEMLEGAKRIKIKLQ